MRPAKNRKGVVDVDEEMKREEKTEALGFQVTEEELAKALQMVLEGRLSN